MKLPFNKEYEQLVIAGMMNNDTCFFDAISEVGVDHFTDEDAQRLFLKLVTFEKRASVAMLMKELPDLRLKSAARTYDGQWTNKQEFEHSLKGLKNTYLKRQLFYVLNKAQNAFDETEGDELIASLQNEMSSFITGDSEENIIFPKDRANQELTELNERLDDPDSAKGIPYSITKENGLTEGFPSLDKAFHGAHGGDLIMIAAKTGIGKTAFALNLARFFSFRQPHWGYYMNTEMRLKEMTSRLLAPIAGVRANEMLYGVIEGSPSEVEAKKNRMRSSIKLYEESKLVMSRIPDLPLHKAQGLARQVKNKLPELEYIIVDYVGRMNVAGFKGNGWDELYEITRQLKELAMTLDVPVFILAQRNDAGDVEGAKKMKNECDGVLYFEPTTEEDDEHIREKIYSINKDKINYKLTKEKVRRDDNPYPIYTIFDKTKNYITEVW